MMTRARLAAALAAALALAGFAATEDGGHKRSADLAWVPAKAALLVSIRPADLWRGELGKGVRAGLPREDERHIALNLAAQFGLPPADIERLTVVFRDPNAAPLYFVRATRLVDRDKVQKMLAPGGAAKKRGGQNYVVGQGRAVLPIGEREYIFGPGPAIDSLIADRTRFAGNDLEPALALAQKGNVLVVGINTPRVSGPQDDLTVELEPYRPLLRSRLATLAVALDGTTATATLALAFANADDAWAAERPLEEARKYGRAVVAEALAKVRAADSKGKGETAEAVAELLSLAGTALRGAALKRDGNEVTATGEAKFAPAVVAAAVKGLANRLGVTGAKARSVANLQALARAMHAYQEKNGHFPPQAVFAKDGKALLSWRVLLLPHLGQAALYKQFKLDEPWDGPHNKALLAKMPAVFRAPGDRHKQPHNTFYQGFVGPGAFFEGRRRIRIADVTDGLSNTLMIAEAGADVPWTQPVDLVFEPEKTLPKLGGVFEGGAHAAFCDGRVRFLRPQEGLTLQALITRSGAEVVQANP